MTVSIHPTALVDPGADLGEGVVVGAFTEIGPRVALGEGTTVGSHCSLGVDNADEALVVGRGSVIRSRSIFYGGSEFGAGLRTGHGVCCRDSLDVGDAVQLGTNCDLQGDAVIGRHTRMHSSCHVGRHSRIGEFVWLFPYIVLTNDPHPPSEVQDGVTLEDFVVVATLSVLLPGITVGRDSLVGAGSTVTKDVPPGVVVAGAPARERGPVDKVRHQITGGPAYPWRRHFHRGYPEADIEAWMREFPDEADL